MNSPMLQKSGVAALIAAALSLAALAGFGALVDGYSHALHPPGLLGARAVPGAMAFNLLGFVLPGLLGMLAMAGVRSRLEGARWAARIGSWLWLLSAFAFALQGLLPLDVADLDAAASRLHANAWTLWWLAFVPGGLLLALGLAPLAGWRALGISAFAGALLLPWLALQAPSGIPAGVAQRIALVLWFACLVVAGFAAQRQAQR